MAVKRGRSQARRSGGGDSGIPGWAWMVLGILLTIVAVIVAPKVLKSEGDGFFRPQPNPDAQPVPVADDEDPIAPERRPQATRPGKKSGSAKDERPDEDYDFYTLLPGKEVPLSDAEIAATERAEEQRAAAQRRASQAQPPGDSRPAPSQPLPSPVAEGDTDNTTSPAATAATQASSTNRAAPALAEDDNTRYLLQAGAFQASGQAEELKARIALLGLSARVESAQIDSKTVYRVRMGPYGTAGDLADAKRKLSAGGLAAMAIKVK